MAQKPVYALVRDFAFAERIAKSARAAGLSARVFDSAEKLAQVAHEAEPGLVVLDCGGLEKEAFQVLGAFRRDTHLSKVAVVGYLSYEREGLKQEMQSAGCVHVYAKTEFTRELKNILARSSHGLSSRI